MARRQDKREKRCFFICHLYRSVGISVHALFMLLLICLLFLSQVEADRSTGCCGNGSKAPRLVMGVGVDNLTLRGLALFLFCFCGGILILNMLTLKDCTVSTSVRFEDKAPCICPRPNTGSGFQVGSCMYLC